MTSRWADKSGPFRRYDFPVGGHLLRIYQVGRDCEVHLLGLFEGLKHPAVPQRPPSPPRDWSNLTSDMTR